MSVTFETTLVGAGKTATGIDVPAEVVEALGGGRRIPVAVTINGHTYPSTIAFMGGVAKIPVSADIRAKAGGIAAGDAITVSLEKDDAPRSIEVPDDLAAALAANPAAAAAFAALSYSKQRAFVDPIAQAKAPETRARRVEKVITDLA
ncbi:YdeI/OmpD-associated family protein [Cnuibacter sp. UC19_7]|uniref:YdeI/OmpD-associated family protein n=1 Tax=Cnuibacter sp. UC19_7 TaxID=3350166 RepID=UPI003670361C